MSVCIRHLARTRYRNTCRRPSDILRAPAGNRTFHFFAIVENYCRHTQVHRNKCIVTKSRVIINNLQEYRGINTFFRTIATFRVLLENMVNTCVWTVGYGPFGSEFPFSFFIRVRKIVFNQNDLNPFNGYRQSIRCNTVFYLFSTKRVVFTRHRLQVTFFKFSTVLGSYVALSAN